MMYRLLLIVAACMLSGCAESKLTVHVDLWTADTLDTSKATERILRLKTALREYEREVFDALDEYEQRLDAEIASVDVSNARLDSRRDEINRLRIELAKAQRAPEGRDRDAKVDELTRTLANAETELEDATLDVTFLAKIRRLKTSYAAYCVQLHDMIDQAREPLDEASELALKNTTVSHPVLRFRNDQEIQQRLIVASAAIDALIDEVDSEFQQQRTGDKTVRRLSHIYGWPDILEQTERVRLHAKSLVSSQAAKLVVSSNPDLAADDGDPIYRTLAAGDATYTWADDFFVQKITADGNAAFVIVRESPVRYGIYRASADPSVLVQSQLRTARAGLNTIGSVASAVAKTYGVNLGIGQDEQAEPADESDQTEQSIASAMSARSQESMVRADLRRIADETLAAIKDEDDKDVLSGALLAAVRRLEAAAPKTPQQAAQQ